MKKKIITLTSRIQDNIEAIENPFVEHLDALLINLSNYFHGLDVKKYAWTHDPLVNEEDDKFK